MLELGVGEGVGDGVGVFIGVGVTFFTTFDKGVLVTTVFLVFEVGFFV